VMGAKFLDANGSGTIADAINAIEFAIQAKKVLGAGANVRVLSNSWGGGGFSQSLLNEINKANASDMLFVAAAGNAGANNDAVASYPSNYNAPNVVAVAATDNKDQLASFSNYGATTVELGAPGVYIDSTVRNNAYAYYSGTSMATPHVSGAAALILSACSLNTDSLRTTVLNTVDPAPALAGKTITGGRLNVFSAIQQCTSPTVTSFTSNRASPYPASGFSPITWTAIALGSVPLEYQFTRQLGTAAAITSSWSASNTFTWTPAPTDFGSWTISVAVRTAGTAAQATALMPYTLTTYATPAVTALNMGPNPWAIVGGATTWTAVANGGVPPLQYQFWRWTGSAWVVVQDYSSANTYSWTPASTDAGWYMMRVWVRNAGSTAPVEAGLTGPYFEVRQTIAVTSLIVAPNTWAGVGTPTTWTAVASGGTAPVQYQFWIWKGNTWVIVQDYSGANTYSWTPASTDIGWYVMRVWVRSAGSTAPVEAGLTGPYFEVKQALSVTSLTMTPNPWAGVGTPTTWTAVASGGIAPVQYQFWLWTGSAWTIVQDYSAASTYTWTPSAGNIGWYVLRVWIRDAGSTAPVQAGLTGPYFEVK
jgi:hypothetical protein